MTRSFSYYIILLVIKLKGIKNDFRKSPIDYLKLRKQDVYSPSGRFFKSENVSVFDIEKSRITEIANSPDKLLIFVHGGAFVYGPSQHHWVTAKTLAKNTDFSVWMCDYPKAPENKISEINRNIDAIYDVAQNKYSHIVLLGDSVGGTLITTLVQRLITNNLKLPSKIFLISPIADASFSNPEIDKIDNKDPMLSKTGVVSAKMMCADDGNLSDESISPLFGSFKDFPTTFVFLAENDISYPDQRLMCEKMEQAKTTVIIGFGMPHIWPLLPVMKEARQTLRQIISMINR